MRFSPARGVLRSKTEKKNGRGLLFLFFFFVRGGCRFCAGRACEERAHFFLFFFSQEKNRASQHRFRGKRRARPGCAIDRPRRRVKTREQRKKRARFFATFSPFFGKGKKRRRIDARADVFTVDETEGKNTMRKTRARIFSSVSPGKPSETRAGFVSEEGGRGRGGERSGFCVRGRCAREGARIRPKGRVLVSSRRAVFGREIFFSFFFFPAFPLLGSVLEGSREALLRCKVPCEIRERHERARSRCFLAEKGLDRPDRKSVV